MAFQITASTEITQVFPLKLTLAVGCYIVNIEIDEVRALRHAVWIMTCGARGLDVNDVKIVLGEAFIGKNTVPTVTFIAESI